MKKIISVIAIFITLLSAYAQQDYSRAWKDFFSYQYVRDFTVTEDKIIALADIGIFIYDLQDGTYKKYSSVNGLSGNDTRSFYYDAGENTLYLGYANGNLEIIELEGDGNIVLKTDLANYQAGNNKSVNQIIAHGDTLYFATPFGIVTFNKTEREFEDTYYIGAGSSEVEVRECLIHDGTIYAATDGGLYYAAVNNPYLVDATQWTFVPYPDIQNLCFYNGSIYGSSGQSVMKLENGVFTLAGTEDETVRDLIPAGDGSLLVVGRHKVKSVDANYQTQFQITSAYQPEYYFRAFTARYIGETLYTATENFGILKSPRQSLYDFEVIHPQGPSSNKPFSITAMDGDLWIAYGGYNGSFEPLQSSRGVDHYDGQNWYQIPFGENGIPTRDNVDISFSPQQPDRVYIASYGEGISVLDHHELFAHWTPENSALEDSGSGYAPVRVSGSLLDDEGNLWVAQVAVDHTLKKYNPGTQTWNSYDLSAIVTDISGLGDIIMDHSDNIWISSYSQGALVYNTKTGKTARFTNQNNHGDLPDMYVKTLAVDSDNRVWIGTNQGMVVFNSSANFFDGDFNAAPVVLAYGEDDQFGEALLGKQTVNDICVDGADTKWFATNSGVLHTDSSGQNTLHLFHTGNSPLPSNKVLNIEFDAATGLVFMATDKGIVAYDSHIAPYGDHLESAYAYPNPVRKYHDHVTIDGRNGTHLPYGTNVKILDAAGHLVFETNVKEGQGEYGGRVVWDKRNLAGESVASGIYVVLLTTEDTKETTVTKIAIIN